MRRLILFELRKLLGRRLAQAGLLAVLLLSALFSISTYCNKYTSDGARQATGGEAVALDKEIAGRYAGTLTDEKVQRMLAELVPRSGPQGLNVIYLYQNATQSAAAARFSDMDGNWNGLKVADVFGEAELKIGYVDGWLYASQDMTKVYVLLSFVILLITAPAYCGDYAGVDSLILSYRYGRTKCASAKAIAGILAALLATAVVVTCNLAAAFLLYGSEGLDCSILFAPLLLTEGYIPFNITCAVLLGYQTLLAFMGALGAAAIALIFSAACKNPMSAMAASAAVHLLPVLLPVPESSPLFRFLALLPLYQTQFVSLMSVEQFQNGILYAALALPVTAVLTAAGFLISRRIFAHHQSA